jgi:putative serine protease PepD
MDDGKPTGPKAKWWSRPDKGRAVPSGQEASEPEEAPGALDASSVDASPAPEADPADARTHAQPDHVTVPAPAQAPAPVPSEVPEPVEATADATVPAAVAASPRPQPLHDPDPYSTPPYGGVL